MPELWTIRTTLEWTQGYLERKGDANPRLSAQWLLSAVTGLSRIQLYTDYDKPLSLEERDVLRDYVARRGQGEPLQYITGTTGFRMLDIKVRPGVLIPRPETEVLVSEALALLPREDDGKDAEADEREGALVADICTGSGCIACSLAFERPSVRVVATDISSEALEVARENAAAYGLDERIEFFEGDLGAAVPSEFVGAFDLVVSNPPYIPTAVLQSLESEVVAFEPALALDGGADGLDLYRPLAQWALAALRPAGGFAVELHEDCLQTAFDYAVELGFCEVRIVRDLAGKNRVLVARKQEG